MIFPLNFLMDCFASPNMPFPPDDDDSLMEYAAAVHEGFVTAYYNAITDDQVYQPRGRGRHGRRQANPFMQSNLQWLETQKDQQGN